MLRRALAAGCTAGVATALSVMAACSGPDGYTGGGRLLILPGQEGGSALAPSSEGGAPPPIEAGPEDASTPTDDGGDDASDADFINPFLPDAPPDGP